ncbi:vacuolar protein sorting-associated protein 16 homolog [Condylostylus longicornis]|uniref:vacuolar protein sorting-associated protein 16 homolog n=1 Tax=Condylostylus longicornis TaxID=2530218 RepID=UPI00244DC6B8|nr:vacuolar protein sorting-associated protein 16 homolog [Condylostylus longicornis]
MPVMYNTGDWVDLRPGNTFRKIELYNIDWPSDLDLEKMAICGAPYGGPIAMIRDYQQILEYKASSDKPVIYIFNCAGSFLSAIKWKHGHLLAMGWNESEELLCVQNDGLVFIYDMFGQEKHHLSICQEASLTKVISAKIFPTQTGTGIAVMTTNFRIFFIKNVTEPGGKQMPEIPKSAVDPTWWEIVSEERNTFCLVAREKELLKLVRGQTACNTYVTLFEKPFKSIILMSTSFNHRYLAIYTNNGIIWLGTTDLKTKFCEFDTGRSERPKQIEWILDPENCRQSDAVIISYSSLLLIVNTNGDQTTFMYDPATFLIPELDGIRILTYTSHELIQKVPTCVSNIFAINSQQPASFLFEAHKKFLEKSHQSDEYLNLIRNKFVEAVDECIEAAGYEFDPETQKVLIKAAYFGKGFIPSHNPDSYMAVCRILRVLNNLRHPKIGMPLTYQQFCNLKADVVLDRLVFRKHYAIAVHVAKHLKLPESRILEHWAFHKIQYDNDDKEVARKIIEKFKNPTVQGVSFSNIADKAHESGRPNLALELLDLEPKASNQVPLLLKLEEGRKALQCAVKSGDTDLILVVLIKLRSSPKFKKDFSALISEQPIANSLFKKYCRMFELSTLQDILNSGDDFRAQADFTLKEGIENGNLESILPNVSEAYRKGRCTIEAELCSDTRKLMKSQQSLSENYSGYGIEFYGLTVQQTLEALFRVGDLKSAEKFKNEYKIPDKRYWWTKIQSLAEKHLWPELEKLSKSKKSPIGYEPFVEVCLQMGKKDEAEKYIALCRDDKKVKWYIRAGKLEKAANLAFEQKDKNSLYMIKMNAIKNNETILHDKVQNLIQQIPNEK